MSNKDIRAKSDNLQKPSGSDFMTLVTDVEFFYKKLGLAGVDRESIKDYIINIKKIMNEFDIRS